MKTHSEPGYAPAYAALSKDYMLLHPSFTNGPFYLHFGRFSTSQYLQKVYFLFDYLLTTIIILF
jgi:hypothetical protein